MTPTPRRLAALAILGLSLAAPVAAPAAAQTTRAAALDLSGGTTGVSGHAQVALGDRIALRMGYNWLDFDADDEEYDGVVYDGNLEFSGFGGFVDLHPFANGFTLTGGAFVGDKAVLLEGTPREPVEIGDETFAPEDLGVLTGEAGFDDAAAFVGLGWDGSLYKEGRVALIVRGGVMIAGDAEVALNASILEDDALPAEARARLETALRDEEVRLADEIDDYAYWPVLTVGLGVGF